MFVCMHVCTYERVCVFVFVCFNMCMYLNVYSQNSRSPVV